MSLPTARLTPLALALGAILLVSACGHRATETFAFEGQVAPRGHLLISNLDGDVEVRVDPRVTTVTGVVEAHAFGFQSPQEARAAVQQVTVQEIGDANNLEIAVQAPFVSGRRTPRVGADLDLVIPPGVILSVETDDGRVLIFGANVDTVVTSNERVELVDTAGRGFVRTSNAGVRFDNHEGDADIRTDNGDVRLIEVFGNARVDTTNGEVEAWVAPPVGGEVLIRTTNALIEVALPLQYGAELIALTNNSDIVVDELDVRPLHAEPGVLEALIGDARGLVDLRTTNGPVLVHRW